MFKKNGSMNCMLLALTIIIIIPMTFGSLGVQRSTFLIGLELVTLVSQQIQYLQMTLSLKPRKRDGSLLYGIPKFKVPVFVNIN